MNDTITIDGAEYIRKDAITPPKPSGEWVLVCGGSTGRAVLVGRAPKGYVIMAGQPYTLEDARMVLYWPSACGGLLGLVGGGPKDGVRMSGTAPVVTDATAHQVLPLNDAVAAAFAEWPTYVG